MGHYFRKMGGRGLFFLKNEWEWVVLVKKWVGVSFFLEKWVGVGCFS